MTKQKPNETMSGSTIAQQVNRLASSKNIPLSVLIELTYRCNLDCYYCYQKTLSKKNELSVDQWEGVIKQLALAGTLYITFSGGECLARKDFIRIVAIARSNGFAVSIITNGTMLTKSIARQLADLSIMDIGISLHASNALLHDELSGIKGSYNRALKALRICVSLGMKTLIKHTVSTRNFGEFIKLAECAEQENCFFECDANVVSHVPGAPSPFALSVEQYSRFMKQMNVTPLKKTLAINDHYQLHCDAGRSIGGISPSGEVIPCIQLPVVFGSVKRTTFSALWNGKKADQFRRDEEILDKSCTYCSIKKFCSRCAGIAYFETGGKWQGSSSCLCNRAMALSMQGSKSKRKD